MKSNNVKNGGPGYAKCPKSKPLLIFFYKTNLILIIFYVKSFLYIKRYLSPHSDILLGYAGPVNKYVEKRGVELMQML